MSYLLSIVIPTKNREFYCLEAVKQILALGRSEIQICVQDNSDNKTLEERISSLGSSNVVYNYHSGVLSFVDNFSEALSLTTGEYICMIGDDDGILPNIIDVTQMMVKEGYDAVIPDVAISYFWPSGSDKDSGHLFLKKVRQIQEEVDTRKALKQLMKMGGQNYLNCGMAKIYHGIVKRSLIETVKEKSGKYFDGLSPDIYMSVLLSYYSQKAVKLYYPCTLPGVCAKSGTADSSTGKHTGELKDAPHFAGHETYEWDSKAPYVYSVETIWADTALHALKNIKDEIYYPKFRVDELDARCYYKYKQFRPRLLEHAKSYGFSAFRIKLKSLKYIFANLFERIHNKSLVLLGRPNSSTVYRIVDIESAVQYVINLIKS